MASKKNFDNLTSQLAEQAKQRFTSLDNSDDTNIIDDRESNLDIENKKEAKKQKTIYLNKTLLKLLKKAAYIKENLDQSEIVAIALERYFESEKIYLENGE
jgi:DNA topoisomerase VI subunit A